jgi:hypothetical protein
VNVCHLTHEVVQRGAVVVQQNLEAGLRHLGAFLGELLRGV